MTNLPKQIERESLEKAIKLAEDITTQQYSNLELAKKNREVHNFLSAAISEEKIYEDYSIYLVVDDALDDRGIPLDTDLRSKWNPDALIKLDEELNGIIDDYKEDIIETSKVLVNNYKAS